MNLTVSCYKGVGTSYPVSNRKVFIVKDDGKKFNLSDITNSSGKVMNVVIPECKLGEKIGIYSVSSSNSFTDTPNNTAYLSLSTKNDFTLYSNLYLSNSTGFAGLVPTRVSDMGLYVVHLKVDSSGDIGTLANEWGDNFSDISNRFHLSWNDGSFYATAGEIEFYLSRGFLFSSSSGDYILRGSSYDLASRLASELRSFSAVTSAIAVSL